MQGRLGSVVYISFQYQQMLPILIINIKDSKTTNTCK